MSIPGGSPHPYMQPQQPNPYGAGYSPYPPPPAPAPGGRSGGVPGWLWGIGGVLLASAAWGGVLFATGALGGDDKPDPAGYAFADDLCAAADISAFEDDYELDSEPLARSFDGDTLAIGTCDFTLAPIGDDDYNSAYVTYDASWHRGSDPAPEFADSYRFFEQYGDDGFAYTVEELSGLGEEAYLVTRTNDADELDWVILAVRDGWFQASVTWNAYLDTPEYAELVDPRRVTGMLRSATESTLAALKE
ncbi:MULTISPECIES: hypothetical protein [Streptomyces]|uniref:hypothetical protein n=1 Tax=Streptomyces TaxID=1883 RepID=UPI001906E599|nr:MULTISPECIES: hypothetical protein [unclassified Streptomyces]MCU4745531.1 hypothetical protein [Streptomyces sp. G-5]QQN79468.1 hypothetical protein IPZ77_20120 [Streptomyces sp. XC 2026]